MLARMSGSVTQRGTVVRGAMSSAGEELVAGGLAYRRGCGVQVAQQRGHDRGVGRHDSAALAVRTENEPSACRMIVSPYFATTRSVPEPIRRPVTASFPSTSSQ